MNEFPVLKCSQLPSDNEFPALDWVRTACKNMSNRFISVRDTVRERINLSRYSLIPVCNLEEDAPLSIIDTLYARALTQTKQILWYSDSTKPDLGGHEDKDFRGYY